MLALPGRLVRREQEETTVHQVQLDSVVTSGLLAHLAQPVALDPRELKGILVKEVTLVLQEVPVHEVLMDRLVQPVEPVPQVTLEMQALQGQPDSQGL